MPQMSEREILAVSSAFQEAYSNIFGQEMYYITLNRISSAPHSTYKNSRNKVYNESAKTLFHGAYKEEPSEVVLKMAGKSTFIHGTITFVTQELIDAGVESFSDDAIVQFTDKFGVEHTFDIVWTKSSFQLRDSKIFTKFGVKKSA
jgi:hypothetical protein